MSLIQRTGFEPGISAHRDCILLRQINLTTDSNFHHSPLWDNSTILKLFGCVLCSAPLPFFKHFQSSFEIVCSFTITREAVLQLFSLMDAFLAHQQYYSIQFKSCLQHLPQFCITIQKLSAVPQVYDSMNNYWKVIHPNLLVLKLLHGVILSVVPREFLDWQQRRMLSICFKQLMIMNEKIGPQQLQMQSGN